MWWMPSSAVFAAVHFKHLSIASISNWPKREAILTRCKKCTPLWCTEPNYMFHWLGHICSVARYWNAFPMVQPSFSFLSLHRICRWFNRPKIINKSKCIWPTFDTAIGTRSEIASLQADHVGERQISHMFWLISAQVAMHRFGRMQSSAQIHNGYLSASRCSWWNH